MYTISSDILNRFQSGQKQYARLTFSNNSTIENDRIIQGTFSINRYVVTGESIGIGSTVAAELSFVLRNGDTAYTSDDFLDEEVFAEIGVMDSNDTIQYVPFGYFTFDDAAESATTINLSALDRMLKFEKTVGTITFPITVNNLLAAACTACSVTLDSSVTGLVNGTYSVTALPDSVKTWREVLQWICEITGTNAWITRDGKLKLSWFATSSSATLTTANRLNSSVGKDVISITGVTILANNVKYTAGTNTRPLTITDNGLISHDHQTVADAINTARNGYSYSSFTATALPLPQLDPMDVITFVKESSNISCPVTDITFKLSGMTTLGCKSDQLAHGRSYGLQDATFYAHNIAANAVTADKISVDDLAALRATIAGWKIATDALYKDVTINGTTYRVSLNAPASPSLTTPAFSVKKRTSSSEPWEEVADILYSGKVISKDFEATGSVKIQPDYDMQAAGVYAIDLEQNGAELYANPNFLNIEEGGSQTHLDSTVISSTAADDTMLRMENYGADYAEFRATQGDYGTRDYKEAALSPKEVRVKSNSYSGNPAWEAKMTSERVSVSTADGTLHTDMEYNEVTADSGDYRASVRASSVGGFLEVVDQNTGNSSVLSLSELTVNDRDILRTHQSLVGGYGTVIPANANLNTDEYCEVGRFYVGADSTAATHTNCPTRYAYMMDVFAPISSDYENTSYIVREIRTRYGDKYVQCVTGSTSKTYSKWVMQLSNASDNTVFADQIISRNMANNAGIRQGSFNGQGQETSANTRIRTGYIGALPNTQYGIQTNYSTLQIYEVHEYTSSQTFIKYTSVNNSSTILKTSSTTGYIRVLMRYSDNRILTPDEGAKLQVERGEKLSAYSPNQAYSERIIVPFYSYNDLGTATTDSAFFQAWLKRIAVNYDYFAGKVIEGRVQPNGTGAVFGHMYGGVNANGMPNYSGFSYISVGVFKYFGTNNGAFYLRSVNYTSEV